MAQTVFQSRLRKFTSAPSYLLIFVLCIGRSSEVFYVNQYLSYKNSVIRQIKSFLLRLLFIRLNAQLDCSRKLLKLTLKFALKCSFMFRFNKPTSGSLLLCFAKVIIVKIVS
jgi:hypothetical protein